MSARAEGRQTTMVWGPRRWGLSSLRCLRMDFLTSARREAAASRWEAASRAQRNMAEADVGLGRDCIAGVGNERI